jgi:membrane protease YdiL (CAAX protease family)
MTDRRLGPRILTTSAVLAATVVGTLAIASLNGVWFDLINAVADATGSVARGLLYSSWLVLIGGAVVIRRPRAFGFRLGVIPRHLPLIAVATGGASAGTWLILRGIGPTPYSDAPLFIEAIVVPLTEELVFRAVLLTILLVTLSRLWAVRTAVALAISFDALAFGAGHLANLTAVPTLFTIGQAGFATVLGGLCAFVMVRTRSVYPAILLHAAVNTTVVLGS